MKVIANVEPAIKKAKVVRIGTRSAMGTMVKGVAQRASYYLQQYTLPADSKGKRWNFERMRFRIADDIGATFATKEDAHWQGAAFQLIKEHMSEQKAKDWYHSYRSGDQSSFSSESPELMDYETKFDRMRKIPRQAREEEYLKYRKSNNYKVPNSGQPSHKWLGFVTPDKRNALNKKRQKTKGLAKAGWKACFHAAGGRGLTVGQGEKTKGHWPPEIKVPYRIFGGRSLGTAVLSSEPSGYRGRLTNHVDYMGEALPLHMKDIAARWTEKYMRMVFELRMKHGRLTNNAGRKAA